MFYLQVAVIVLNEGCEPGSVGCGEVDGRLLTPVRVHQGHHEPLQRRLHVRVKAKRLA